MSSKKVKKCLGPGPRAPMVATPMWTYVKGYANYYTYIKFESSTIKMASGMLKMSKSLTKLGHYAYI